MDFIDQAKIYIKSGDGGKGCISFRREKFVPFGGPDGGSGGWGGDVIFRSNPQLSTLLDFKYQQHYAGENGRPGGGQQKTGRSGKDCLIEVPVGTLIRNKETQELLYDFEKPGEEFTIAKGGIGGRGNMFFASPTNQAPRHAEEGKPGLSLTLQLELKLLADVALVGYPNAGKSTLVSAISAATCKSAEYPFTTLIPQLAVVTPSPGRSESPSAESFVVADIPGLIEGAHTGRGLGMRFLRHIERSRLLWFVLEATPPSLQEALVRQGAEQPESLLDIYEILSRELQEFSPPLTEKPRIVVINKMDLGPDPAYYLPLTDFLTKHGIPFYFVSAIAKTGLQPLLWESATALKAFRQQEEKKEENPAHHAGIENAANKPLETGP